VSTISILECSSLTSAENYGVLDLSLKNNIFDEKSPPPNRIVEMLGTNKNFSLLSS